MTHNQSLFCKARAGFTLIEMLTVVLIIGILTAVVLPQYRRAIQKAEASEVISMLRVIHDSRERLVAEFGYRTFSDMASSDDNDKLTFNRMDMFDKDTIKCDISSGSSMVCEHFQYDLNKDKSYITATKLNTPYKGTKICLYRGDLPEIRCKEANETNAACDLYNIATGEC